MVYFSLMSSKLEAAVNDLNDEGTSKIQKTKSLLVILDTIRPLEVADQMHPALEALRKGGFILELKNPFLLYHKG